MKKKAVAKIYFMSWRYFIVNENIDEFYELTNLIPEFMKVEKKTEQEAIEYFMQGLNGARYQKFSPKTPTNVIREWIMHDIKGDFQ